MKYNDLLNEGVKEFLKVYFKMYDRIIFKTKNGAVITSFKYDDFLDNSILINTLKDYPNIEFNLSIGMLDGNIFDLNDEFAYVLFNNIMESKKRTRK